ncbi:MAG: class I adenylate-forming enzyme family protein [Proteobacteria bacterium]|nr:class I adenylate-forming enzyme family protein [Pseudomonadota bacterium]
MSPEATVLDDIRAHANATPDHPAIAVDERGGRTRTITYSELVRRMDTLAVRLRRDGVRPGQRCGLVARQGSGFVEAALAIIATDACVVPIPDDHTGAVLDAFAARSRLHHLVAEADDFAVRDLGDVPSVDGAGDEHFRALRPAYLRFTSGTTSERKGVVIGHDAIRARLAAANRGLEIGPEDRILWLLPMAHHFVVSILLYLRYGATLLLPASSLARDVLDFSAREGATVFYASPYHCNLLAKDTSEQGLDGVRLAISTAEGLRREIADRFAARFGLPLVQALGIIEVGLSVVNLERAAEKPEALGRPLPDYDVWLRAEDGKALLAPGSPERTGEICIRGPGLFDAYLDPWTPSREILEPDGFRTGDQGWFDADGDLFLAGRRKNRISMAGMKFFSEEVEAVLDTHPAVRVSRVSAREHAHLGEIPVAEIVPEDPNAPPDRKTLSAFCREQLATYKIPREFRVVDDLELTPTGKLRR